MSVAWLLNRQSSEKDRDKFLLPFHYGWSFCAEDAWIHSGDRTDTSDRPLCFISLKMCTFLGSLTLNLQKLIIFKKEKKKKFNFDFVHFDLSWLFYSFFFLLYFIVELHWKVYKCSVLSFKKLWISILLKIFFIVYVP